MTLYSNHRSGSGLNYSRCRERYDHSGEDVGEVWLLHGGFHINVVAAEVLED